MSERSAEKDAPCPHEHTRAFRDLQGGHVKCLDCGARITTAPRPAEHGLRRGWFADTADNPTGDYQWQPCLETGQGHIPCFEVNAPSVIRPDPDNPIIHRPGCSWETTPYCDCGADPERPIPPAQS